MEKASWRRCSVHGGSKEEYDLEYGKREWANISCLNVDASFIWFWSRVYTTSMEH